MKEEFVTGELARKLLEKGCPISKVYKDDGIRPLFYELPKDHPNWQDCDAWYVPTVAQVLKWLREYKKIHINIDIRFDGYWFFDIWKIEENNVRGTGFDNIDYPTYEKAALAAIEYVLDNLI